MKWIKANERLPEDLKRWYIVRQANNSRSAQTVWWEHIHGNIEHHLKLPLTNIEWLDESVDQSVQPLIDALHEISQSLTGQPDEDDIEKALLIAITTLGKSSQPEQTDGWIKVEGDNLPEDGKRFLVYASSGLIDKGFVLRGEWERDCPGKTFKELGYEITHYMELPKSPSIKL